VGYALLTHPTFTKEQAKGKLIGGNSTVLASIFGSLYLPDFTGLILFLEDIGEDVYEIDRLLNQLKLAGILNDLAGFVFGQCTNCSADSDYGSLTLEEVIREYIQPLKIPACLGLMIGHLEIIETIAIGIEVELDANRGKIIMLESAVI
jgi:muramoyltetrapeptide carboxypeptidase